MNKIVNEIMNAYPHRYGIDIYLTSYVSIHINCCECFIAFDHETLELEIHKEEEKEFLDAPILTIKQENIVSWE